MKKQNKKKLDTLMVSTESETKNTVKKDTHVVESHYYGTDRRLHTIDAKYSGTERRLRVSEEIYRRLFETARDGILILESETGSITDVNPFLTQLLGYSKEEFLGKKLWKLVFSKIHKQVKTCLMSYKKLDM
jgi:PAS domain-containing protein